MTRVPAGRLNGLRIDAGTVLGPKEVTREYVVATGNDEHGLTVGYATVADLDADALAAMAERGPQSVAEARLLQVWQQPTVARLRALFGPLRAQPDPHRSAPALAHRSG